VIGEESATAVALLRLPGTNPRAMRQHARAGSRGAWITSTWRWPASRRRPMRGGRHARRYPSLDFPITAVASPRHRGVGRRDALRAAIGTLPADEQACAKIDLIVTSVLLDAGQATPGDSRNPDGADVQPLRGLAVASFRMFEAGLFSERSLASLAR